MKKLLLGFTLLIAYSSHGQQTDSSTGPIVHRITLYVAEKLGFVAFAAFSPVLKITSKWKANIPSLKICHASNIISQL
jgi:hypothetical protein